MVNILCLLGLHKLEDTSSEEKRCTRCPKVWIMFKTRENNNAGDFYLVENWKEKPLNS